LPSKEEYALIEPLKEEAKKKIAEKKKHNFELERNYLAVNVKRKALAPNPLSVKTKKKLKIQGKRIKILIIFSLVIIFMKINKDDSSLIVDHQTQT
jgi:hypothetical protein